VALTVEDLPRVQPAPWPDARPVVEAALEQLRTITDDDTAAIVEHLVLALVDIRTERDALRDVVSGAIAVANETRLELVTLERRYHDALDSNRQLRAALQAAAPGRAA
jgi:hypothetical protein